MAEKSGGDGGGGEIVNSGWVLWVDITGIDRIKLRMMSMDVGLISEE